MRLCATESQTALLSREAVVSRSDRSEHSHCRVHRSAAEIALVHGTGTLHCGSTSRLLEGDQVASPFPAVESSRDARLRVGLHP